MEILLLILFGTHSVVGVVMVALYLVGLWFLLKKSGLPGWWALEPYLDQELVTSTTLGELADRLVSDPNMAEALEIAIPYQVTVSQIIDLLGWENVRRTLQDTMGEASLVPEYERSRSNIASCWVILLFYTGVYAALATIALEFIDKDKR